MTTYNIYLGEYPFDVMLGFCVAETAEQALDMAIEMMKGIDNHPVVAPADSITLIN